MESIFSFTYCNENYILLYLTNIFNQLNANENGIAHLLFVIDSSYSNPYQVSLNPVSRRLFSYLLFITIVWSIYRLGADLQNCLKHVQRFLSQSIANFVVECQLEFGSLLNFYGHKVSNKHNICFKQDFLFSISKIFVDIVSTTCLQTAH